MGIFEHSDHVYGKFCSFIPTEKKTIMLDRRNNCVEIQMMSL